MIDGWMDRGGMHFVREWNISLCQRTNNTAWARAGRLLKTASCSLWLPGISTEFHQNITTAGRLSRGKSHSTNEAEETMLCGLLLSQYPWSPQIINVSVNTLFIYLIQRIQVKLPQLSQQFQFWDIFQLSHQIEFLIKKWENVGRPWDRGQCSWMLQKSYQTLLWGGAGFTWELWYAVFQHSSLRSLIWFGLVQSSHRWSGLQQSMKAW